MLNLLLFFGLFYNSYAIYYDANSQTILSKEQVEALDDIAAEWCVNDIEPCDPNEGRRVDATCNNLDNPLYGAKHSHIKSLLPSVLKTDYGTGDSASYKDLPLARRVRTELLLEGKASDQKLTTLATNFILYLVSDIISNHDSRNYIKNTTNCCNPEHFNDFVCAANIIPEDDPVHRYGAHRCFNMTRPYTFQSQGCTAKGSAPERISEVTSLLDLSDVYGSTKLLDFYRTLEGGLFKYELLNGKAWPLSSTLKPSVCSLNSPTETRCHDVPAIFGANSLAPINMVFILLFREHNEIAKKLSKVNPCWSDQKLFDTARDINIAKVLQIYYYEVLPLFFGKERMEKDEIISSHCGFRDVYDKNVLPQISLEYPYALRWMHTLQEGDLEMYNENGTLVDTFPVVNLTLRTGYFATGKNLGYLTQGSFRQACGGVDKTVDPDMAENALGGHQAANDVCTSDLAKGRYYGLQPYIKYRELCSGKPVTCWDDLKDVMDCQNIEKLKKLYKEIEKVEVLAGMWLENLMPESKSPPTFYCIMKDQLLRFVKSDRHWYERRDRPNAFNIEQILEIRKANIARLLCDNGDSVTEIQPNAFLRHGHGNEFTKCSNIKDIDYSKWADPACNCDSIKGNMDDNNNI